jgi:hypothetical protein
LVDSLFILPISATTQSKGLQNSDDEREDEEGKVCVQEVGHIRQRSIVAN